MYLLVLVLVAAVASFLIKIIMDWRSIETIKTEDVNENYGNLDPGQYYEEEKKSEILQVMIIIDKWNIIALYKCFQGVHISIIYHFRIRQNKD